MPSMPFEDILLLARQESHKMRHYYIGVEHLLVALLEIRGGIARSLMEIHGLSPEYVINAIRLKMSKGSRSNQLGGTVQTPRAARVLEQARALAHEHHLPDIDERTLLLAILKERDGMVSMTLEALGLHLDRLTEEAYTATNSTEEIRVYALVDYAPDYPDAQRPNQEQLNVLRRMFPGYARIRVERRLIGGYTRALLLVVTPIQVGNIQDAAVVVKIDQADRILDEVRRYEQHVEKTLPPLTARLVGRPTTLKNSPLGGVTYTLIAEPGMPPRDLRAVISEWGSAALGAWLRENLFPSFGLYWWKQSRHYRFTVWREYDWLLPPVLGIELIDEDAIPPTAFTLRFPIRRGRLTHVQIGSVVIVENFTVRKVDTIQGMMQLAIGLNTAPEMAYKVEVRGLNLKADTYYRGEVVERLAGRVVKTRSEQLHIAARALSPDFDLSEPFIPLSLDRMQKVPNPLLHYEDELERQVHGSLSRVHGDLHLGNVMIGPNNSAFLIDFAKAREGHTLFDWASLEISILSEVVMPKDSDNWDDARRIAEQMQVINAGKPLPDPDSDIARALAAVVELRAIAQECLARRDVWSEYFVALGFCGLRALTWDYMQLPARRLMFLLSGLAFHELHTRSEPPDVDDNTRSPDETDLHTTL